MSTEYERPTVNNTDTPSQNIANAPIGEQNAGVHPSAIGSGNQPDTNTNQADRHTAEDDDGIQTSKVGFGYKPDTSSQSNDGTGDATKYGDDQGQEGQQEGGAPSDLGPDGYPPQLHAGKVGYGPNYATQNGGDFSSKITGLKEEVKGKILRKPELVETGHARRTGELAKKKQSEEDANDPFATAKDDNSEKPAETNNDIANGPGSTSEPSNVDDNAQRARAAASAPADTTEGQQEADKGQDLNRESVQ
ncbi:hypothetical protein SISNIDRAFT_419586 [Sistotremastrum niveocremeum HHB9708]|uniref:Uncharacterized protein n=1 Tax=Sistotremastrum niveocremeum HHB9708 TaxID=1314777 RepID=A0A164N6N9_9AGAM|nr:hypothetical protein SISNIDRAFT_419586 [Sistotremastrum niveocremeum HHB9708]